MIIYNSLKVEQIIKSVKFNISELIKSIVKKYIIKIFHSKQIMKYILQKEFNSEMLVNLIDNFKICR